MRVLAIIPAYNEELNIESTVKDIENNTEYDYIVIDDCSKDNTKNVCIKNKFNIISLPINFGLTSAIQVGMKYAKEKNYDVAVQFDGDGQHKAKHIRKLVNEIESNDINIAVGSRFVNNKKPLTLRMMGSRIITVLIKIITGQKITDPTSGMRAYDRKSIEMFNNDASLTPEPDTLVYMIKKGLKVKEVQVEMSERRFGESYLNKFKSIKYMINMIVSILFIRITTRK